MEKRTEFLSLAVSNAKSRPISDGGRDENAVAFLTQLEEKLEVAQAQLEILHLLEQEYPDRDQFIEQKIYELKIGLKTVTEVSSKLSVKLLLPFFQLFEDYADPLNMPEIKLLLFHVSEHQDQQHLISTWRYLFDQRALFLLVLTLLSYP